MKNTFLIVAVLVVLLGGYLVFRGVSPEPTTQEEKVVSEMVPQKSPEFSLQDFMGNTITLADFSGKNTVLNSWAVWCPFCVEELKDFARIQEEFGDKIIIVAINRAESLKKQKQYLEDLGIIQKLAFLLDPNDSFYRSIGGFSMPETLFVNGDGEILLHKRGPLNYEQMKKTIQELYAL